MSSADPHPGWPPPGPHRPRPVAFVLAVVLPIIAVIALIIPLAVGYGVGQWRRAQTGQGTGTAVPPAATDEGGPGVGDPYFPDYGSSGYDALSYRISMTWDTQRQRLEATTTINARSTQVLKSLYVDLALTTTQVSVNGRPATFRRSGFQDVKIIPADQIPADTMFEMVIDYSGQPGKIKRGQLAPWMTTNGEWTVAGEPESSAWWFPANDHPSDAALMDISVRVPAGLEVLSVGRLESRDTAAEQDFDTWHWVARQPLASYLSFVSIGQFTIEEGVTDGRPFVYAVSEQLESDERERAMVQLRRTGEVIRNLEGVFGPYPFSEIGGVVPAADLAYAGLETQTRPLYARGPISNARYASGLLSHELAHMWFGDNIRVKQWNDIFTNEAYASWSQWIYRERSGAGGANQRFKDYVEEEHRDAAFWRVTMIDPGRDHLFSTVYERGPMTLQALRNVIGDAAFFELSREWAQDPGSRSLEEWMIKAQSKTSKDLVPFFQAWIFSPTEPAHTAANGFPS